jgi:hypothetical protein
LLIFLTSVDAAFASFAGIKDKTKNETIKIKIFFFLVIIEPLNRLRIAG